MIPVKEGNKVKKNENHSHNNSSETISGSLNSYENSKIAGIEKAIDYNFKNKTKTLKFHLFIFKLKVFFDKKF